MNKHIFNLQTLHYLELINQIRWLIKPTLLHAGGYGSGRLFRGWLRRVEEAHFLCQRDGEGRERVDAVSDILQEFVHLNVGHIRVVQQTATTRCVHLQVLSLVLFLNLTYVI